MAGKHALTPLRVNVDALTKCAYSRFAEDRVLCQLALLPLLVVT